MAYAIPAPHLGLAGRGRRLPDRGGQEPGQSGAPTITLQYPTMLANLAPATLALCQLVADYQIQYRRSRLRQQTYGSMPNLMHDRQVYFLQNQ